MSYSHNTNKGALKGSTGRANEGKQRAKSVPIDTRGEVTAKRRRSLIDCVLLDERSKKTRRITGEGSASTSRTTNGQGSSGTALRRTSTLDALGSITKTKRQSTTNETGQGGFRSALEVYKGTTVLQSPVQAPILPTTRRMSISGAIDSTTRTMRQTTRSSKDKTAQDGFTSALEFYKSTTVPQTARNVQPPVPERWDVVRDTSPDIPLVQIVEQRAIVHVPNIPGDHPVVVSKESSPGQSDADAVEELLGLPSSGAAETVLELPTANQQIPVPMDGVQLHEEIDRIQDTQRITISEMYHSDYEMVDVLTASQLPWTRTEYDSDAASGKYIYVPAGLKVLLENMRHTLHLESQARQRAEMRLLEEVTRRVHAERTIESMKKDILLQRSASKHLVSGDSLVSTTSPISMPNSLGIGGDKTRTTITNVSPYHSNHPASAQGDKSQPANIDHHGSCQVPPEDELSESAINDLLHKAGRVQDTLQQALDLTLKDKTYP